MEIELRPARRGDAGRLAELAAAVLPEAWSAGAFQSSLGAPGAVGLVASERAGGLLLGYALGSRVLDALEILSLAVDAAHQRRGIGSALLCELLARQRAQGARHAHLEVRVSNTAALALYSRCGFAVEGRRRAYYADGDDALRMGIAL